MPEIATKYPASILKELKDIGAKCGEGLHPQILTQCPAENFCVLPTGEICIYDLDHIMTMTQITPAEWSLAVKGVPGLWSYYGLILAIFIFGVGLIIGMRLKRN